jgi:hypothetical protein
VDSKPNWVKQAGLTPGKMALIAVLAMLLGGVLYIQLRGTSAKTPSSGGVDASQLRMGLDNLTPGTKR